MTGKKAKDLLRIGAAALEFGVSTATLRNWVKAGTLKADLEDEHGRKYFVRGKLKKQLEALRLAGRLSSRRNKSTLNGRGLYENYADHDSPNAQAASFVLDDARFADKTAACACLIETAIRLLCDSGRIKKQNQAVKSCAEAYLKGELDASPFDFLLDELIGKEDRIKLLSSCADFSAYHVHFIEYEDTLGLIYLTLTDISSRLSGGRFYTPQKLSDEVVSSLGSYERIFFDPCCGSGNFLLRLLKRGVDVRSLYGADIDPISLTLAKIGIAVNTGINDQGYYKEHFLRTDTLICNSLPKAQVILGNPPWGCCTDHQSIKKYAAKFRCAYRPRPCLADLFVEKALTLLPENGILRFLLPEALLGVDAHKTVRELIARQARVLEVDYLGDVFHDVQCPSVVLTLKKGRAAGGMNKNVLVKDGQKVHTVKSRSSNDFSFRCDDAVMNLLNKMDAVSSKFDLTSCVRFGMGIVTGDNERFIKHEAGDDLETVLRGSNIEPFCIKESNEFLAYTPALFQQCAKQDLLRAPRRILYRFISRYPVATLDLKGRLTLNSCNFMALDLSLQMCRYLTALLNSKAVRFYFLKRFNTVKILRSHLENLPLPNPDEDCLKFFEPLCYELEQRGINDAGFAFDKLQDKIFDLYDMNGEERALVLRGTP